MKHQPVVNDSTSPTQVTGDSSFESLCKRQQELENRMLDRGAKRFSDQLTKNLQGHRESANGSGRRLLIESIQPVAVGIQAFLTECLGTEESPRRRVGRQHVAINVLKAVGSEEAALIISKTIIDNLSSRTRAATMAREIAGMLLDELRFRKFREKAPGLFEWKLRNFNTSSYAHMKRSLDASINFAEIDVTEFDLPENHRILLGNKCLELFVQTTHYVEIERTVGRDSRHTSVVATQATLDWVERCNGALEFLSPVYMPTLIPPRPWSNTRNGGYWFGLAGQFPLMRTDGRHQLDDLDNVEMPVVYGAVNALQETSWCVNERVLAVIDEMKQRGNENAALPSYTDDELPAKPVDIETNEVARKRWRGMAHEVHERNHARKSKALGLSKTLATARLLSQEIDSETGLAIPFYFPYNLDFRGRAYAIPLYLQPQGDDIQKGLLRFGHGKMLRTQAAADWLAIHGANCLAEDPISGAKLDKLPLDQRIAWIDANTRLIEDTARDPMENLWWTAADSPFCFLAFCFEWTEYKQQGLSFVSHIPVAMDGSCNGLQHYSALLRDEKGGAEVNLIPSDTPKDIYRTVAEKVITLLQNAAICDPPKNRESRIENRESRIENRESNEGEDTVPPLPDYALDWLTWGKVDRKFVKRQVMTLPYGSKEYGFRKQIAEYVSGLDKADQPQFVSTTEDRGFSHFNFMAGIVWQALADTVVAACDCMEYFQKLARLCVRENLPIAWTAPNGLPIVQGYREENMKRVRTTLCEIAFSPAYFTPTKTYDKYKQVSGIAPNVIHSLDAAAMMLTVVAACEGGVSHFAMIHDSYGTHATDAPALASITRQEFIRMYRDRDVLSDLENGLLSSVISAEEADEISSMPVRPCFGMLSLDAVATSPYFFA